MISATTPMSIGGSVHTAKPTRLKPAAAVPPTPNSRNPRAQKNCHEPMLPGVFGKNVPTIMIANSAAAWRKER